MYISDQAKVECPDCGKVHTIKALRDDHILAPQSKKPKHKRAAATTGDPLDRDPLEASRETPAPAGRKKQPWER